MGYLPFLKQVEAETGLADAATLDGAVVEGSVFGVSGTDRINLYAHITYIASTKMSFELYLSPDDDGSNMYQSIVNPVPIVYTLTATDKSAGAADICIGFDHINAKTAKVVVISTSGAAGDMVTVKCLRAAV